MLSSDTTWRRRRGADSAGGAALGGTGLAWVSSRVGCHGFLCVVCCVLFVESETAR